MWKGSNDIKNNLKVMTVNEGKAIQQDLAITELINPDNSVKRTQNCKFKDTVFIMLTSLLDEVWSSA